MPRPQRGIRRRREGAERVDDAPRLRRGPGSSASSSASTAGIPRSRRRAGSGDVLRRTSARRRGRAGGRATSRRAGAARRARSRGTRPRHTPSARRSPPPVRSAACSARLLSVTHAPACDGLMSTAARRSASARSSTRRAFGLVRNEQLIHTQILELAAQLERVGGARVEREGARHARHAAVDRRRGLRAGCAALAPCARMNAMRACDTDGCAHAGSSCSARPSWRVRLAEQPSASAPLPERRSESASFTCFSARWTRVHAAELDVACRDSFSRTSSPSRVRRKSATRFASRLCTPSTSAVSASKVSRWMSLPVSASTTRTVTFTPAPAGSTSPRTTVPTPSMRWIESRTLS